MMRKLAAGCNFSRIPKIARALKAMNPDVKGVNILNNNGEVAFQSVFHSHIHFNSSLQTRRRFRIEMGTHDYSHEELANIAQNIAKHVEG